MDNNTALIALARNYKSIHIFNIDSNKVDTIKSYLQEEMWINVNDAKSTVLKFAENLAAEESIQDCTEFLDLETIQQRMMGREQLTLIFRDRIDGWCRASFIRIDEKDPVSRVIFAVESIDQQIQKENKKTAIVSGLAESFETVCYIDRSDELVHLIRTKDLEEDIINIIEDGITLKAAMHKYASAVVLEDDARRLEQLADVSYVDKALQGKERLYYTYRRVRDDNIVYYRLSIVPFDEGRGLIYGYENIDDVVRKEAKAREKEEQYNALVSGLCREYASVWSFDADKRVARLVRNNMLESGTLQRIVQSDSTDYDDVINWFINSFVEPQDQEHLRSEMSIDNLIETVRNNELYQINFALIDVDGNRHYMQACIARDGKNPEDATFVCGFRDVNAAVTEQIKQQQLLQETNKTLKKILSFRILSMHFQKNTSPFIPLILLRSRSRSLNSVN